jgi:BON domain-containing protein
MSPFRYREEDSSTGTVVGVLLGALAGFAAGMFVAQKVGGVSGLTARLRRSGAPVESEYADEELDDYEEDELDEEEHDESLEERVLEAFRNDPILSERAIDIGSVGEGTIELAGWVESEDEAEHAVTIARGVPDVTTVVNRISVGEDERRFRNASRRVQEGDPSLTETRWEGRTVGTGRRRQGTSQDADRHADPKVDLEDRWMSKDVELANAADDTEGLAERRRSHKRAVRGDRTGGAPVAPTGVPKADHVASPREADVHTARVDAARDTSGERTDFGDLGRP